MTNNLSTPHSARRVSTVVLILLLLSAAAFAGGQGKRPAAAGTLVPRLGTLWFGVIVGPVAFAVRSRRLALREGLEPPPALAAAESLPETPA